MGSKTATKLILLLGLLVILATSAVFIFLGSYIIHISGTISDLYKSTHVLIPTIVILSVGVILVLLVLIGFFGCIMEKKTLLVIFFTLLCLVFLFELSALTMGLVFKYKIKTTIDKQLYKLLKFYSTEVSLRKEIDYIQSTLQCCGVQNYTDWEMYNNSIPDSCCRNMKCKPVLSSTQTTISPDAYEPYIIGCSETVEKLIQHKFVYIILILISVIALQVISLVASCCIIRHRSSSSSDYQPFNNRYNI